MADVFISYASADRERVAPLVRRLEQLGFSVWWDRDIAHGQNYHRTIQQALDAAKCAVVVWTEQSVNSEWVVNEASSARKRNALVPVLLDAVEPPLEFRHLQTADLREDNPNAESEYAKLKRSVQQLAGGAPRAPADERVEVRRKPTTRGPAGWALGAGALLLGAAALLAVLKQLGWIGAPPSASPSAPAHTEADPPNAAAPAPSAPVESNASSPASPAETDTKSKAAPAERANLLSPEQGAQIVAASEENWRRILEAKDPVCSIISGKSFAAVGLRNEQPATFDTLAVHVEAESSYNLKTLALFVADAERGPFTKMGEFEIPNYKNMRAPFHEFKFASATARFVKLQVQNFYHGDGPNGNVCTMRLYEAAK